MTKQELQEIFEDPFNWDNWRKVMDFVFPEFQFSAQKVPVDQFTKAAEEKIEGFYHHGSTSLTDHISLNLYEVALNESVNLPRNVKEIRKFIASEAIANTQASVAVFYSPDLSKWRFTLAIKQLDENFKETDRKPESYTYVFGEGERGRTAAERFYDLSKIENKKLKDLEEAFSVEKLSKKFFTQYKEVYLEFVDNIKDNPSRLNLFQAGTKEEQEKLARDFVKKMMGRIVFLYFLQKKGWMGCKSKWQEGEDRFMQKLFEAAPQDSSFYMTYLEPLFFDTLNAKREESEEDCEISGENFGKVPFLNGGLFEREDSHPDNLTLDWDIFNRFFETLNNYNFTIIEDDPDFKEIAVDPEMLGHIFENLLEDNKDKGAFYTPKEIVQYMCQESLIEYLNTQLGKHISDEALKDAIRDFVVKYDFVALNDINQRADQYVLQALRDIKVCDPAIGSGAFPMGILHEIYRMVEYLQEDRDIFLDIWDKEVWDAARVKEDIIQNSIYGVDIEKGAVDIARLRFWLSIIIEEEEPKPLPNLDYKIVVGNSLLNKFEDHVIDIEWEVQEGSQTNTKTQEFLERRSQLLEEISDKQKTYFDTESSNRVDLSQEIKDLKIDILINQLEMKIADEGTENEPKLENFRRKAAFVKAQKLYFQTLEWKDIINELQAIKGTDKLFNHFDWKLDFPEILNPIVNESAVGFDLVIGNPPYDVYEGEKVEELEYLKEKWIYEVAKGGKLNAYKLFTAKSIEITKDKNAYCLIFQNSFLADREAIGVRKENIDNQTVIQIDSFPERDNKKKRVFESVKMSVCILLARKEKSSNYDFTLNVWEEKWMENGFKTVFEKSEIIEVDKEAYQFPMLKPNEKQVFVNYYSSNSNKVKFGDVLTCYRGELNMTTQRPYFTYQRNDFPALKGAQIQKYKISNDMSQGELEYVLKGKYIEENRGPKSRHFELERCVTQRITGVNERFRLKAALLGSNTFCADSCNYIIGTDNYPNDVIMALLNSNLFNWIFKKTSTNSNVNGYEVENLKLPILSENSKELLSDLASQIMDEQNSGNDVSGLEKKVDTIVYKLFEFPFHEVQLIEEGNFGPSEEEYDNLSLEDMEV